MSVPPTGRLLRVEMGARRLHAGPGGRAPGPLGIRVNTICPTFIETPMTEPFFRDEAFRRSVLSKIKLGRLGRVEDVVGAAVYLAEASALMTGSALMLDGGWTAD